MRAAIGAMPKAELHVHADGCVRVSTIAELARQQGIRLPVPEDRLHEAAVITEPHPSLASYLERYALQLRVLQEPEAVERMIYELAEDARRENVRYIEPRFGPALHTRHGMTLDDVVQAACHGWNTASREYGVEGGLILCAIRDRPPEESLQVARAGERFLGAGVIGFDIAGPEAGHLIRPHGAAFDFARAAGYGITAHAGEAAGPESVWEALDLAGATRIGHGMRSMEDPSLLVRLREDGITLEMCPKSNVQTSTVESIGAHPIRRYYGQGIRVTVNTDARVVSDTTVTAEMASIHKELGVTLSELRQMTAWALEAGFAPAEIRERLRSEYLREP